MKDTVPPRPGLNIIASDTVLYLSPGKPVYPVNPVYPVYPVHPVPRGPVGPVDPDSPVHPVQPVPRGPVIPVAPVFVADPGIPCGPVYPDDPVFPINEKLIIYESFADNTYVDDADTRVILKIYNESYINELVIRNICVKVFATLYNIICEPLNTFE